MEPPKSQGNLRAMEKSSRTGSAQVPCPSLVSHFLQEFDKTQSIILQFEGQGFICLSSFWLHKAMDTILFFFLCFPSGWYSLALNPNPKPHPVLSIGTNSLALSHVSFLL